MNKILLLLFLCGMTIVGKAADGDILNEDFSTGFSGLGANEVEFERNGWTISGCSLLVSTIYPSSLIFCYSKGDKFSYATSPVFGEKTTNCAVLTFSYARFSPATNEEPCCFSVILNGGGEFEDGKGVEDYEVTTSQGYFNEANLKIFGATPSTTITFQLTSKDKYYFALDDVKVTSVTEMALSEFDNNMIDTKTADVNLIRTLTGGIWNTLCLPFDVNQAILKRALGDNQDIQLRTYSSYADGVMHFSSVDNVAAGTPFLVKLNETKENPVFECVDVKDTPAQTIEHNGVKFVGVYSPEELPDDDGNVYMFLTANGTLMKPNSNSRTLKGMRAYFSVPATEVANARVAFDDDGITSVNKMPPPVAVDDAWYTLSGIGYAQQPVKGGLYIKNGKKIIIK